jgi:hypothetical protein
MGWRILLISLVGVILVSTAAPGTAPQVLAQQTIGLEAPKWDAGDHWAWQLGGDQVTWTVLGASGEYSILEKSPRETGTIHVSADFSSTRESSLYFLPPFYQLQFPLTLGKVWTYTVRRPSPLGAYTGDQLELEVTRIIQGVVSITVPAGTFDSIRIYGHERSLRPTISSPVLQFQPTIGYGSGDFIVWYAPKVKQVARITWRGAGPWDQQYRSASLLLVSYKLHNP